MTELERTIISLLQEDLPLVERPFVELASRAGVTENGFLAVVRRLEESGVIRRFGATVRHRRLGVQANGMSVWNVPEERQDEVGELLSACEEVSHCYVRPAFDGFPYSLYAMIHGTSREAVAAVAGRVADQCGISDYALLYSTRELKKTSMKYFQEEDYGLS